MNSVQMAEMPRISFLIAADDHPPDLDRVLDALLGQTLPPAEYEVIVVDASRMHDRAGAYERALREARDIAVQEMTEEARERGANAVIGVDLDYETVGEAMLMVSASGTAVRLE